MATKKYIPSAIKGIPKPSFNFIVEYLLTLQLNNKKFFNGVDILSQKHPTVIFQYYKNFQLMSRLRGSALCLLKTQFAKKPKNPV